MWHKILHIFYSYQYIKSRGTWLKYSSRPARSRMFLFKKNAVVIIIISFYHRSNWFLRNLNQLTFWIALTSKIFKTKIIPHGFQIVYFPILILFVSTVLLANFLYKAFYFKLPVISKHFRILLIFCKTRQIQVPISSPFF